MLIAGLNFPRAAHAVFGAIGCLLMLFGGAGCSSCSSTNKRIETHRFVVIAHVTRNGAPLPHGQVDSFNVKWRGWMITLRAGDTDGEFKGTEELKYAGEWHEPPTSKVEVDLSGPSFRRFRADRDAPLEGKLIDDYTLSFELDVTGPDGTFEMQYVDEQWGPIPGARLTVITESHDGTEGGQTVITDKYGKFVLHWVEVPFTYYVSFEHNLDEKHWLITPDRHRPGTVDLPTQIVKVTRRPIVSAEATFIDREFAETIAKEDELGRLVFLLMPLERPTSPFRRSYSLGDMGLNSDSRLQLSEQHRMWLGEIPDRRQYLVIFSLATGVWAAPTEPLWQESILTIPARIASQGQTLKGKVAPPPGKGKRVGGTLILDAYVPHNAVPAIYQLVGKSGVAGGPGWAVSNENGDYTLSRIHRDDGDQEDRLLTIATPYGGVYHVLEPRNDETLTASDNPGDGIVEVTVLGPDGRPLPDVAVHLTSIDTSENDVYQDSPQIFEMTNLNITNSEGKALVTGVFPAEYVLAVSHALVEPGIQRNFRIDQTSIRVVTIQPGRNSFSVTASMELYEECRDCKHPDHDHGREHDDQEHGD
jgi:hypothetical protein